MTVKIDGSTGVDKITPGSVDKEDLKWVPPFTAGYISTPRTCAFGGLVTIPHGLGREPTLLRAQAYVAVAMQNWSVGDKFDIPTFPLNSGSSTVTYGVTVYADATNIYIRCGSGGVCLVQDKNTGFGNTAGPAANIQVIVGAWA